LRLREVKELGPGKWLDSEQEILNAKISGRNFVELTAYRGVALWWFIRFRLYHSAEANRLAELLVKNPYIFSLADFLYDFLTSLLCKFISTFFRSKTDGNRPKVLMFASNSGWGEMRDRTGRSRKGDVMLDPLIKQMEKRHFEIVTVTPLKYSISAVKIMIERLRTGDTIHRESNAYWSIKTWIKEYYANKYFRNIWERVLESDEKFVALIEKYPLIREMRYYFNSLFGHVVKQIEIAKEVVSDQNPDLILATSEYGFFERGLVVAGKLNNIPTLAIQHGNIGPVHEGYIYSKNSISASGSIESPYCPIPDKTAVYGQFYYDILTNLSAYPFSSVVVTGQPRYDKIVMANRIFSREQFCAKLGLDPLRKIVLVATQGWPMREVFIRSVLGALKKIPEVQIVIKPHPRENSELYRMVVDKQNVKAVILSKSSDTVEALYACDVLVAAFSTVITEALVLGKPAVTVNLTDEDPTPYYKEVTMRVNKQQDLASAIREALHDNKTREKLKKAGRRFVFNHAYKQNGKATQRVADLIEQMISRRA